MTQTGSGGLVVDAEVSRGSFTLAVSLTAAPGQVLGVLGPNGAGKSTLLSAVAGLTPISGGRITLTGQVMDDADSGTFVEAFGRPVGFRLPELPALPAPDRRRERGILPAGPGPGTADGQGSRRSLDGSAWADRPGRP